MTSSSLLIGLNFYLFFGKSGGARERNFWSEKQSVRLLRHLNFLLFSPLRKEREITNTRVFPWKNFYTQRRSVRKFGKRNKKTNVFEGRGGGDKAPSSSPAIISKLFYRRMVAGNRGQVWKGKERNKRKLPGLIEAKTFEVSFSFLKICGKKCVEYKPALPTGIFPEEARITLALRIFLRFILPSSSLLFPNLHPRWENKIKRSQRARV